MANLSSSVGRVLDVVYEKYNQFDESTHRVAAQLMGRDVASINKEDPKQVFCAWVVKIAAVAMVALAAYAMIQNPLILLAGVVVGAIFRPEEQTRQSIEGWLNEAHSRVIQPIMDNESIPEKLAVSFLALTILGATLTTVVAPAAIGIAAGYKASGMLEKM